jgi:hypothetical protein
MRSYLKGKSDSGIENRLTAVGSPPRWPRDTPLSTKVGTKFRRQVPVAQSVEFARGLRATEFVCLGDWVHGYVGYYLAHFTGPGWWISVEQSVEWLPWETEVVRENLPHWSFDHHKCHMSWSGLEPGQTFFEAGDITTWATVPPLLEFGQ